MSTVTINITGLEQGYNDTWTVSSVNADGTESQRSLAVDTQAGGYSQSISGKACIVAAGGPTQVTKTLNGVAKIVTSITSGTKTQTGRANVKATIAKVQSGKANIKVSKNKNQSGLASIVQVITGTGKTINGRANIRNNTSKSISGKSSVKVSASKNITGVAKITINPQQSITGLATIVNTQLKTLTGKSKILNTYVSENWDSYATGTTSWSGWTTKLAGLQVNASKGISSYTGSYPAVAYYSGKTFSINQYSKAQVVAKAGAGVVVRCGSGSYYYAMVCDTTTNTIYLKTYNGQYLHSNISTKQYTVNTGDYIEVRIIDGYISGWVNDSLAIGPFVDPGYATSGSPGIVINSSLTGSIDNWSGGEYPSSKTITGKAAIIQLGIRNISGISNIKKTSYASISGLTSISRISNKIITGKADIKRTTIKNILGTASIIKVVTKNISGIARIQKLSSRHLTGTSSILRKTTRTVNGKAAIIRLFDKQILGISSIVKSSSRSINGTATIAQLVPHISLFGVAPVDVSADISNLHGLRIFGKYGLMIDELTDDKNGAIRISTGKGIKSIRQKSS